MGIIDSSSGILEKVERDERSTKGDSEKERCGGIGTENVASGVRMKGFERYDVRGDR